MNAYTLLSLWFVLDVRAVRHLRRDRLRNNPACDAHEVDQWEGAEELKEAGRRVDI